jgi:hypothetical protein
MPAMRRRRWYSPETTGNRARASGPALANSRLCCEQPQKATRPEAAVTMKVFISYSLRDEPAVRSLVADLVRADVDVWLEEELSRGDAWWTAILEQIRACTVFVVALSDEALDSRRCRVQLEYAKLLGLPIVPVQIGKVASRRADPIFTVQWVDYRSPGAATAMALIAALHQLARQRTDLPDPLPEPPPNPCEYLHRLRASIDCPELAPSVQEQMVLELRNALSEEDDDTVREDIRDLLRILRRRNDITYPVAREIDAILGEYEATGTRGRRTIGAGPPRAPRHPESQTARPKPAEPALPFHAEVHFTVYPPRFVRPGDWTPLLAFAHLGAPPDKGDTRDPFERVREQAEAILGPRIANYRPMAQGSKMGILENAEITFELDLPGFDVERPQRTFLWTNAFRMEDFAICAAEDLHGTTVSGRLLVYHGSFLIGEVVFFIRVDAHASQDDQPTGPPSSAAAYRKIFASYSHEDTVVVEEFERHFAVIGDDYLRDVRILRSGEKWNPRLLDFIREADVFQLFWSHNAIDSPYVEQEWRYALSLNRPNFVRPFYWERPMPQAKARGIPPKELGDIHFHALGTALAVAEPPAATTASAPLPHWDEPEAAPTVSAPQTSGPPMSAPTNGSPSPPTTGPHGNYYGLPPMATGRRRSPRGRYIGAGLAAAVVALGVTFAWVTALTHSERIGAPAPPTATQSSGPTPVASGTAFDPSTGARLSVTATPQGAGSELTAEISDIPRGGTARLVVIARDGARHQIDQWVVTSYGVNIRHLTTSLSPSEIASVAIEDPPGQTYLSAPVE